MSVHLHLLDPPQTADLDAESLQAWRCAAEGCERGLAMMSEDHPDRHIMQDILRNVRVAAQLPPVKPLPSLPWQEPMA